MLTNPGDHQPAASGGPGRRHHAGGLSGASGAQVGAACCSCCKRGDREATRWSSRERSIGRTGWPSTWWRTASTLTRIHGNRSQAQRREALAGFKAGKYRVLVATDIAARGIDVEALGHVVNFDVPAVPEDYIHRVGRTGRAELTGEAFTFVAPEEEGDLRAIERAIGQEPAASHAAGLRLQGAASGQLEYRWPSDRGDSRAKGSGACTCKGQRRAQR